MEGPARAFGVARFGPGTQRMWLYDVFCLGDEAKLEDCFHGSWGEDNGVPNNPMPVGIQCNAAPRKGQCRECSAWGANPLLLLTRMHPLLTFAVQIRLANQSADGRSGRLEVLEPNSGRWGTVRHRWCMLSCHPGASIQVHLMPDLERAPCRFAATIGPAWATMI